jgi:Leucine-rich repeat (LRR) protein
MKRTSAFIFILFVLLHIHRLHGWKSPDECGHKNSQNCLIEATFGTLSSNESIGVFIKCTEDALVNEKLNHQFLSVDSITWNGCRAIKNLKNFAFDIINTMRKQIKFLKIENFHMSNDFSLNGFSQLEILHLKFNLIEKLSSTCFDGLSNLRELQMSENNLKSIDANVFSADFMPKLKSLRIHDKNLLMVHHQFKENQIIDDVTLEIYNIEMDLVEHHFHHVRNLSISLSSFNENCAQTVFNGYEKSSSWMIEHFKVDNFRCGFMMENVETIKTLELKGIIVYPYGSNDFMLKDMKNLQSLSLTHNEIVEISSAMFIGEFDALESIDLSFNGLHDIDAELFINSFPKLNKLNLTNNLISKIENLDRELKFQMFVDENSFNCGWIEMASIAKSFANLIYTNNLQQLNINGLKCIYYYSNPVSLQQTQPDCENDNDINELAQVFQVKIAKLQNENFIMRPKILALILFGAFMLGFVITFLSIYTYNRRQLLKHQPFYHMLRDTLIRPMTNARESFTKDFKNIILRNLPPTNYEHPISENRTTNQTDMTEIEANIYEEIPYSTAKNGSSSN